jgi:hypothetical protein
LAHGKIERTTSKDTTPDHDVVYIVANRVEAVGGAQLDDAPSMSRDFH